MAKKSSWSNTKSLFRFLRKNEAQSKEAEVCFMNESQTVLIKARGFIIAYDSIRLTFLLSLPGQVNSVLEKIYLDDIKKIDVLS